MTSAATGHGVLPITRRDALSTLAAITAAAASVGAAQAQQSQAGGQPGSRPLGATPPGGPVGWDAAKGEFTLPPLPYAPEALEPHIDATTMSIHHGKHHAGYVNNANKALRELARIRQGEADAAMTAHWTRELSFNLGGHVNHTLFWMTMAPEGSGGGGRPDGSLSQAIERDFGTFDAFVKQFKAAAGSVMGSGWAWLVHEPLSDRLMVVQVERQHELATLGMRPLLGVDVWEHAYYLKYQNRRAEYVDAFMNVINWPVVAALYGR